LFAENNNNNWLDTPLSLSPSSQVNKTFNDEDTFSKNSFINEEIVPLPELTWASNYDLWIILKNKENLYKHDSLYLRKHAGITAQMRAILLDWLVEVSSVMIYFHSSI
jgi:hypothetical protein